MPAVDRAVRLLEVLARNGRDWTLTELAQEVGIHKGTTRDILLTLQRHSLVSRDAQTGRFRLGIGVARFARSALDKVEIREIARPTLAALAADTHQTALLVVRSDHYAIIVDVVEPPDEFHLTTSVGRRVPLTAGAIGKVYLSPPAALENFLAEGGELRRFTSATIIDHAAYARELARVRAHGYATDDEEYIDGVRAVAAAVDGDGGEPAAVIALVGFTARIGVDDLDRLGRACLAAARTVSARIGAQASPVGA